MAKPKQFIISKDAEEWIEGQRVITQKLRDEADGDIKLHIEGRLEFIELIQQYIKEGLIKIMEEGCDIKK